MLGKVATFYVKCHANQFISLLIIRGAVSESWCILLWQKKMKEVQKALIVSFQSSSVIKHGDNVVAVKHLVRIDVRVLTEQLKTEEKNICHIKSWEYIHRSLCAYHFEVVLIFCNS